MSDEIELRGVEAVRRLLGTRLRPAIEAGAQGIAAEALGRTAPYPPEVPRRPGKSYYVRGKGYFTADGKLIAHSETLNRKWAIRPVTLGAALENRASYAGRVKGRKGQQMRRHERTGWTRTIEDVQGVFDDGTAEEIMRDAILAATRRGGNP